MQHRASLNPEWSRKVEVDRPPKAAKPSASTISFKVPAQASVARVGRFALEERWPAPLCSTGAENLGRIVNFYDPLRKVS